MFPERLFGEPKAIILRCCWTSHTSLLQDISFNCGDKISYCNKWKWHKSPLMQGSISSMACFFKHVCPWSMWAFKVRWQRMRTVDIWGKKRSEKKVKETFLEKRCLQETAHSLVANQDLRMKWGNSHFQGNFFRMSN